MRDSHVLLYRASDRVEANLLAHALAEAGIRVDLAGGMSFMLAVPEEFSTDMWVRREDYERGRRMIEDFQRKDVLG